MPSRPRALLCVLLTLLVLGAASVPASAAGRGRDDRASLLPARGALFGVSIDWGRESVADYARRLGRAPAVVVYFTGFPLSAQEEEWLDQAVDQAAGEGSDLLLTVEPFGGLDVVTRAASRELARRLAGYNRRGVGVYVRFAHEMNGSWYPWGQQPDGYVAAFRRMARAVHSTAPRTAMMWAPNYGGGYPFAGGVHQAPPGGADAQASDTDGDGRVTQADDPYAPFWPGRRFVDWVGMSVYHWGAVYPWGENEVPEDGKFQDLLRGTYDGAAGDERAVPDFYARYGAQLRLPVAVTETAALYVPGRPGPSELEIKSAWWEQVLSRSVTRTMPRLRMINWFEWSKHEPEVGTEVDWTVTLDDGPVRRGFVDALPGWLRFASR